MGATVQFQEELWPAGTMAALATIVPVGSFKVETTGFDCPVGHTVKYPRGCPPMGTAVKLNEYASAELGMSQLLV